MKISVSLPDEDIEFLDRYARENGIGSRSATLHDAVRLLRAAQLEDAYAAAWQEWADSGDSDLWEPTAADGLRH